MIGTYSTALGVVLLSALIGQAALVLCGWRRPSWLAPATGFGLLLVVSWWGASIADGGGALAAVVLLALVALFVLVAEGVPGWGAVIVKGLPAVAVVLAAVSIPFVVEGHFGVLGTGFNVDMSQHLFVAEWLRTGDGSEPALIAQGYPVGPHSLAAAAASAGPNLVEGFTGVTMAIPLLAAATALLLVRTWRPGPRVIGAALIALPYMVASAYAQGSFKELAMALFFLAFALGLRELASGEPLVGGGWAAAMRGVPLGLLAAGALYSYSSPALAWLGGALVLWLVVEISGHERTLGWLASGVRVPALLGAVACLVLAAPELPRIAEFASSAKTVAEKGHEPREAVGPKGTRGAARTGLRFNNDYGNLFPANGDLSGALALGIWPSGDFRVEPGGGKVPGIFFYAGSLIALATLWLGLRAMRRNRETALLAALGAAAAIWFVALVASTPYAAAKALVVGSPLLMLAALLAGPWRQGAALIPFIAHHAPQVRWRAVLVAAFVIGSVASSLVAIGNAPVGPSGYSDALARMRHAVVGRDVVVEAPAGFVRDEHGDAWLRWELRGAKSLEIINPGDDVVVPADGRVVTFPGNRKPPLEDSLIQRARDGYRIWFP